MSDLKRRVYNFIMDTALCCSLAIVLMEGFAHIERLKIDRGFFLLYFLSVLGAGFLIHMYGRPGFLFGLLPAYVLAVWLVSRDVNLLLHVVLAWGLYMLAQPVVRWKDRRILLTVVTALLLVMLHFMKEIPAYTAACAAFLVLYVWMRYARNRHTNWSVLLVVVAVAACLLPAASAPMGWEPVKKAVRGIATAAERGWKNLNYFIDGLSGEEGTTYAGYSESGQIGGAVHGSGTEALLFESTGEPANVYLRGAEYAKLSPAGFLDRDPSVQPVNAWLAMYLNCIAQSGIEREEARCFSRAEHGSVTYGYIRTSDLLIPSTVFQIRKDLRGGLDHREKKGFHYDFNYLQIDYGSPYLWEAMELAASKDGYASYEDVRRIAADYYQLRLQGYMTEEEYDEAIRIGTSITENPTYLDTSMSTERIRSLAGEITADAEGEMDAALRIEEYLRSYPYDTEVDLRGAENYVDDFLFETKRGYCMHYASAMVLLLRECGIPARFVQGYLYKPEREGIVYGDNAHAWVEAYMPSFGWVRFEPTGAETGTVDASWGRQVTAVSGPTGENSAPKASTQYKPDTRMILNFDEEVREERKISAKDVFFTVGRSLLLVVAVFAGLILLYMLAERIRYARLSEEEKLSLEIRRLKKHLQRSVPADGTIVTAFDYLPYVEEEARAELSEILWAYYRVRFRGDPAGTDLVQRVRLWYNRKR